MWYIIMYLPYEPKFHLQRPQLLGLRLLCLLCYVFADFRTNVRTDSYTDLRTDARTEFRTEFGTSCDVQPNRNMCR